MEKLINIENEWDTGIELANFKRFAKKKQGVQDTKAHRHCKHFGAS